MLGHRLVGSPAASAAHVAIVTNDWLSDTSTWDGLLPLLAASPVRLCLADLRGYGLSRDREGACTIEEAAGDVLELAAALGWERFAVVGHSMSSLIALHVAQIAPERVTRAVVIGPPPPAGLGYDDATFAAVRALALGDDEARLRFLRVIWSDRLSEGWTRFKLAEWRRTSRAEAVAEYAALFGRRGLPEPTRTIQCPLLAVTGEHDSEPMRRDAAARGLAPIASTLGVAEIPACGHYPMQETPPWFLRVVERFLCDDLGRAHALQREAPGAGGV
jgi:pimeloyl-ACP methyl ester carboxylesterase